MHPRTIVAALCALSFALQWLGAGDALAQAPPPAERSGVYSPYEQQTIDDSLKKLHARAEPSPEGKTIEQIEVVPLEVIEDRDPLRNWLNVFHVTTRPSVVQREMLLREGAL